MDSRWAATSLLLCLIVLGAVVSCARPVAAQSTGSFQSPTARASHIALDVGGFLHAGTESADLYAVSGVMPFRLEASIEVAVLGPRLTGAVTGSFGGVYDASLRDSLAAGRSFFSDLWAVTNPLTGARLSARVTDALRLLFGVDLVWPGRDVHDGELGTSTEPELAAERAQRLDSWDPFLYQGSYAHVVTRFELEVRFDSSFVGGELALAAGIPASSRAGWTTVCGELGVYGGTWLTPAVAIGLRAHATVVDDGPRVRTGSGGLVAADRGPYGLAALAPFLRVEHDMLTAELRAFFDFADDPYLLTVPGPIVWSLHTRLGIRFDAHSSAAR